MIRKLVAASLATAALAGATAAHAGTHWSIGINLPVAGVVVSDGRYIEPAPVYYAPPPPPPQVVYVPAPRYVEREVYYAPPPPPRVIYEASYRDRRCEERRWERERREHRWADRRDDDRSWHGR